MRTKLQYITLTVAAFVSVYWLADLYDRALRDRLFFDGWVLCAGIGLQLLFHVKKMRPAWLLGSVSGWLQFHTYTGWFVVSVFALHTRLSLPDMVFEWVLWALFIVVALSGLIGTYLTSAIPTKLEQHSKQLVFEQIPVRQHLLAQKVANLASVSIARMGSSGICELYAGTLHDFFGAPKNPFAHLRNSRRPLKRLLFEISRLDGDLDPTGQQTLSEIRGLVEAKDRLDFQHAHEQALKSWLFVHVPATYALVVLTVLHVGIVYAYRSGAA